MLELPQVTKCTPHPPLFGSIQSSSKRSGEIPLRSPTKVNPQRLRSRILQHRCICTQFLSHGINKFGIFFIDPQWQWGRRMRSEVVSFLTDQTSRSKLISAKQDLFLLFSRISVSSSGNLSLPTIKWVITQPIAPNVHSALLLPQAPRKVSKSGIYITSKILILTIFHMPMDTCEYVHTHSAHMVRGKIYLSTIYNYSSFIVRTSLILGFSTVNVGKEEINDVKKCTSQRDTGCA
jgi:hypothetical protein